MSRTGDPYPLVRSPWGRTATAPDLSPAEAEIVAAFESAPTPPEVREAAVVEEVARAIWDACNGEGSHLSWDDKRVSDLYKNRYRDYAAAAVAAYRATQDGGAEAAVDVNGCPDRQHHGVDCPGDACRFAASGERVPNTDPLTAGDVAELPDGTPVTVIWSGGNGPHDYVIHACDRDPETRYVWDGETERLRHYNPLRFVGAERYHTRVWRQRDALRAAVEEKARELDGMGLLVFADSLRAVLAAVDAS